MEAVTRAVPAIGVVGTAKNTGKTTTLVALLQALAGAGLRPAVTSIGFDGESQDHITGLPKPRIDVTKGALVATAERVLPEGTAALEPLCRTGVQTALGEVVIGRATASGRAVLAGPATGAGLRQVLEALVPLEPDLCLVDGAFGRMAPMVETDGLILATGAARSQDLATLVAETRALLWLFRRRALPPADLPLVRAGNLLTPAAGAALAGELAAAAARGSGVRLDLTGAIAQPALAALLDNLPALPFRLEVRAPDPVRMALAGPPAPTAALWRRLSRRGRVGVAKPLPLLAVTVNPFYPEPALRGYEAAFIDARALHAAMAGALSVPVIDTVKEGKEVLFAKIRRKLRGTHKRGTEPRRSVTTGPGTERLTGGN
ncbi:MAG: hypothetical protein ACOY94_14380 [Bacillota bacterium]